MRLHSKEFKPSDFIITLKVEAYHSTKNFMVFNSWPEELHSSFEVKEHSANSTSKAIPKSNLATFINLLKLKHWMQHFHLRLELQKFWEFAMANYCHFSYCSVDSNLYSAHLPRLYPA